jgi:hypothetical protein
MGIDCIKTQGVKQSEMRDLVPERASRGKSEDYRLRGAAPERRCTFADTRRAEQAREKSRRRFEVLRAFAAPKKKVGAIAARCGSDRAARRIRGHSAEYGFLGAAGRGRAADG